MNSNLITISYFIYLPLALSLTYFVARTLFRNSKVFMLDIFNGREDIALSTNKLFEIGFYLINIGVALYLLKIGETSYYEYSGLKTVRSVVEVLSAKLGGFSIYLGIMVFLNLFLFFRGKKVSKQKQHQPKMSKITL